MADEIPNTKEIGMYLHCGLCLGEIKSGEAGTDSPKDYSRLEIGYTRQGLQIWCVRHDCNVAHIDYQGKSPFPANLSRRSLSESPLGDQG